jgi:two-component system OmpR family sensor kinase
LKRKILAVTQERLTRHELSWLLAQEARGAARALRDEVGSLKRTDTATESPPGAPSLDALDDAIEMLTALNSGKAGAKGRHGRIDLAALLYEIAPNARIAIAPGSGTEVFGDETELRRMLNVLVAQFSAAETEIRIGRQGDWIRISIELGPDVATTGELERRWLSRMATRHGGWIELEGGTQTIFLQADGASDKREVTELKKELAQAQKLGEAYARELATMLVTGEVRSELPPLPDSQGSAAFEMLRALACVFERRLKSLADSLRADAALGAQNAEQLVASVVRRASGLQELAGELAVIAECPLEEATTEVEVASVVREAVHANESRSTKQGVSIQVDVPAALRVRSKSDALGVLVRMLISHGVAATPRGGTVAVSCFRTEIGAAVRVEDGGPAVPEAAREPLLRLGADPSGIGRPAGIALLAASATAGRLGAVLELRQGPGGAAETWVLVSDA